MPLHNFRERIQGWLEQAEPGDGRSSQAIGPEPPTANAAAFFAEAEESPLSPRRPPAQGAGGPVAWTDEARGGQVAAGQDQRPAWARGQYTINRPSTAVPIRTRDPTLGAPRINHLLLESTLGTAAGGAWDYRADWRVADALRARRAGAAVEAQLPVKDQDQAVKPFGALAAASPQPPAVYGIRGPYTASPATANRIGPLPERPLLLCQVEMPPGIPLSSVLGDGAIGRRPGWASGEGDLDTALRCERAAQRLIAGPWGGAAPMQPPDPADVPMPGRLCKAQFLGQDAAALKAAAAEEEERRRGAMLFERIMERPQPTAADCAAKDRARASMPWVLDRLGVGRHDSLRASELSEDSEDEDEPRVGVAGGAAGGAVPAGERAGGLGAGRAAPGVERLGWLWPRLIQPPQKLPTPRRMAALVLAWERRHQSRMPGVNLTWGQ
ncbi:hypothetical protein HYH03_015410 [Edaphochlamys debaryana]|uniref:Uncharacterized protein n=1 Tax=Edaphochlamys debaryana TaxID=47281 RepID=A0A835XM40_9CHLO|nr:hypothetical protein HYH03_015410 [Edaphochlamys debaryana]|eukprot:KAG2485827.1 hypothetical protein HYH03_015410 [Edaphochlamys debaryana]